MFRSMRIALKKTFRRDAVRRGNQARGRGRLLVEPLEGRVLPSTYAVVNTADSGPGSLRQAILDSNATSGPNVIDFNIAGDGVQTISLQSALPTVTTAVTIDGTSQPGFAGTPLIVLDGSGAGSGASGLTITAGNSTVEGLAIDNFAAAGVALRTGGGNVVADNFIGVDSTGAAAAANGTGISITGSSSNTIGGTAAGIGNVISGNTGDGVEIFGSNTTGNLVEGNYIGTDNSGAAALGNGSDGVAIHDGASSNTVGGSATGAGNLISANTANGVDVFTTRSTDTLNNVIAGNLIGTDVNGTAALGNGSNGVLLSTAGATTGQVAGTTIGGTAAGAGNIISANGANGVEVFANGNRVEGNLIGTDINGTAALGNGNDGVLVTVGNHNTIGGSTAAAGNVISANAANGVEFSGSNAFPNTLQDNYIGTDVSGTVALGNGNDGVYVQVQVASGVHLGDTIVGNVISANTSNGLEISGNGILANSVTNNKIGTDVTGTLALGNGANGVDVSGGAAGNSIGGNVIAFNGNDGVLVDTGAGNSILNDLIFSSGNLGIELTNGGNNDQAAPALTSATSDGNSTTVQGTLTSTPNKTFTLQFFANTDANPSGFGEGQQLLGSAKVTTDASGFASFTVTFTTAVSAGEFISATATDSASGTSAFAQDVTVSSP